MGVAIVNAFGSVTGKRFPQFPIHSGIGQKAVAGVLEAVKCQAVAIPFCIAAGTRSVRKFDYNRDC